MIATPPALSHSDHYREGMEALAAAVLDLNSPLAQIAQAHFLAAHYKAWVEFQTTPTPRYGVGGNEQGIGG